jgi:phosphoribosylformylglycinamidine synthase subunit PurS
VIYAAEVRVMLKPGVNDPQGLSIQRGLHALGFQAVSSVRAGKLMQIQLEASSQPEAEAGVRRMCEQLLANPVIEQYSFALEPVPAELPGHPAE